MPITYAAEPPAPVDSEERRFQGNCPGRFAARPDSARTRSTRGASCRV